MLYTDFVSDLNTHEHIINLRIRYTLRYSDRKIPLWASGVFSDVCVFPLILKRKLGFARTRIVVSKFERFEFSLEPILE